MSQRNPEREVKFQKGVLDAINTLLEVSRIRQSPAAASLAEYRDEILAEFERDTAVADRYRRLYLPSGPVSDMRGVESKLLGRVLRAAMEPAEEEDDE